MGKPRGWWAALVNRLVNLANQTHNFEAPFMNHVLQIVEGSLPGQFLKGPRSPADVRKLGYAFTGNAAEAWPFATQGEASRKRHAVAKHMSWPLSKLKICEHE